MPGVKLRKIGIWYLLLNKRLFLRPAFWLLMAALPVLALGLLNISGQESGVLKIAVCAPGVTGRELTASLRDGDSVIAFTEAADSASAAELVVTGAVDAAWVLPEALEEKTEEYVKRGKPVVEIYEREESTVLRLAEEKLYKALFPSVSYAMYRNYMEQLDLKNNSPAQLRQYYDAVRIDGALLHFVDADGGSLSETGKRGSYLLSPLRGMMAVWLVFAGFAAAVFFRRDVRAGRFVWVGAAARPYLWLLYQLVILLNGGAAMLAVLSMSGLSRGLRQELPALCFLLAASLGFSNFFCRLCGNIRVLSAVLPALLVLLIAGAPIFIDLGIPSLQRALPIFYYLNLVYRSGFSASSLIYLAGLAVMNAAAAVLKPYGSDW